MKCFFSVIFIACTTVAFAQKLPSNDPLPEGVMYRGVTAEQWQTIKMIGDPLDCQERLYEFQTVKNYKVISPVDCESNRNCIQDALKFHDNVKLKEGRYEIEKTIYLKNKILVGDKNGKTLIDASQVTSKESVILDAATISNIQLENAFDNGIYIKNKSSGSLVYRVKVGNSGSENMMSVGGKGINIWGNKNRDHCIISAELYNGYNNTSSHKNKSVRERGGNADGIDIKDGPANITIIDVHSHHNSDDGFDFFSAGNKRVWDELGKKKEEPIIRVFYSSAFYNGQHPLRESGDGEGFKLGGSSNKDVIIEKNFGARLIYGSAACSNSSIGISRNRSASKIIALGNDAKNNEKKNFDKISNKKVDGDEFLISCASLKIR